MRTNDGVFHGILFALLQRVRAESHTLSMNPKLYYDLPTPGGPDNKMTR